MSNTEAECVSPDWTMRMTTLIEEIKACRHDIRVLSEAMAKWRTQDMLHNPTIHRGVPVGGWGTEEQP